MFMNTNTDGQKKNYIKLYTFHTFIEYIQLSFHQVHNEAFACSSLYFDGLFDGN